jgi:hypothetical protein
VAAVACEVGGVAGLGSSLVGPPPAGFLGCRSSLWLVLMAGVGHHSFMAANCVDDMTKGFPFMGRAGALDMTNSNPGFRYATAASASSAGLRCSSSSVMNALRLAERRPEVCLVDRKCNEWLRPDRVCGGVTGVSAG